MSAGTFERYLTEAEERKLFAAVKSRSGILAERDHAWMRLLRATAMRVGALSKLTCGHAREALRSGYLELEPAIQKRKVGHRILVTKKCRKALQDLLRIRRELGHPETPDAPLIMSRNHKGMSVRSFQARMQMWREAAGLDVAASPHWWRHTVAKRLMKQSTAADPRGVVQGVLGHKNPNSTAVYTRPDRDDIDDAMQEVC